MEQMFWSLLLGSHVVEPTSELLRDLCKNLGIMRIVCVWEARHSVTHFLFVCVIFQQLHPKSLPGCNGAIRSADLLYGDRSCLFLSRQQKLLCGSANVRIQTGSNLVRFFCPLRS